MFCEKMSETGFKASTEWTHNFKKRHSTLELDIASGKLSADSEGRKSTIFNEDEQELLSLEKFIKIASEIAGYSFKGSRYRQLMKSQQVPWTNRFNEEDALKWSCNPNATAHNFLSSNV